MASNIYVDGQYLEHNPTWHVEGSPWKAAQVHKMIARHSLPVGSVCEVGCGSGEILRQLQALLPEDSRFVGYDISPQAIALCRERENDRLQCHCADFLTQSTEPFDLLLCMDVIEHVEDLFGFLRGLRGRAQNTIFHIPLALSAQAVLRASPLVRGWRGAGHIHHFMQATALLALADAGYEVVDHFYTAHPPKPASPWRTRLARLPRTAFYTLAPHLAVRLLGGYSLLVLAR